MAFLKSLKRSPKWANGELARLRDEKDLHPKLKGWWLSSGMGGGFSD